MRQPKPTSTKRKAVEVIHARHVCGFVELRHAGAVLRLTESGAAEVLATVADLLAHPRIAQVYPYNRLLVVHQWGMS